MKRKLLFRIVVLGLIIATIICSVLLEQKRLDENEQEKFHDRFKRDEYIDSVIRLYTSFNLLGLVIIAYSIYNIYSFLLYKNIDGKMYKIILTLIFDFAAIIKVCLGYEAILYAKASVINQGIILSPLHTINCYIFAMGYIILSRFFKISIEKEYEKEVKKVLESDYGKKWIEFSNKLGKNN